MGLVPTAAAVAVGGVDVAGGAPPQQAWAKTRTIAQINGSGQRRRILRLSVPSSACRCAVVLHVLALWWPRTVR
jgi:hypothetical protein